MGERRHFAVNGSGGVRWVPLSGDLVLDVKADRLGKAVGWDGDTGAVTLYPLYGIDGQWETTDYRPADRGDRLRARVIKLNRERRW
ncbi:hypothetical protein [Streptomyces sp. I05A-00742]|uniref:hypothetical protein n=1 Tax=Streptomyces sp. I05A-00742 TaxID=2732853 RepID=UPI001489AE13|nr:hypothetical protein [Streptomyces sp. I05A-00742]